MLPPRLATFLTAKGHLGFIPRSQRTTAQARAHAAAEATFLPHHGLPLPALQAGTKVLLPDLWKHPDVVADVGFAFDRFHQLTGSCVGAGGGNGLFSTIAAQRVVSDTPTRAFLPFWLSAYGMSRHYMGDDGQGEGSLGSSFAKALTTDGIRDWASGKDGLPAFTDSDGVSVSERDEMTWSSYRNPALQAVLTVSRTHLVGSAAVCKTSEDIQAAVTNGYGVTFACDNYIGRAAVEGSGADACLIGFWDGRGGHQQSVHGFWEHPQLGPLYWAQNNWPGSTYPRDPAGGPVCGCWVRKAKVDEALQRLDAEVYALSHLAWFPAQPKVLDQFI